MPSDALKGATAHDCIEASTNGSRNAQLAISRVGRVIVFIRLFIDFNYVRSRRRPKLRDALGSDDTRLHRDEHQRERTRAIRITAFLLSCQISLDCSLIWAMRGLVGGQGYEMYDGWVTRPYWVGIETRGAI